MNFFPDVPLPGDKDGPEQPPQPAWMGAPEDVVPGVVPVELILGRSEDTVVMLAGMRAFPTGLGMRLGVRVRGRVHRRDLHSEVFDGPYTHDMDADWQTGRLKVRFPALAHAILHEGVARPSGGWRRRRMGITDQCAPHRTVYKECRRRGVLP